MADQIAYRRVWKYPLLANDTAVDMPRGAEILCVRMEDATPVVYARVDPRMPKLKRILVPVWNCEDMGIAALGTYVGTYEMPGGTAVHLFDVGERP